MFHGFPGPAPSEALRLTCRSTSGTTRRGEADRFGRTGGRVYRAFNFTRNSACRSRDGIQSRSNSGVLAEERRSAWSIGPNEMRTLPALQRPPALLGLIGYALALAHWRRRALSIWTTVSRPAVSTLMPASCLGLPTSVRRRSMAAKRRNRPLRPCFCLATECQYNARRAIRLARRSAPV